MKNLFITSLFLISSYCFSQYDYGNTNDALELCLVLQEKSFSTFSNSNDDLKGLTSNSEAEEALEKILSTVGASKRFIVKPCANVNNAIAIQYKGLRYIFYDPEFINSVSKGNSWSSLFILAHEVGHHINGHSLDIILYATESIEGVSLTESRQQELEADEFAGFVLAKLGASLEQTIYGIDNYSSDADDINSTHPTKSKRLTAIERGYKNAFSENQIKISKVKIADDFFYSGLDKADHGDYIGAIADYTVAIGLEENYLSAYNNRGLAYLYESNQYDLSLRDFNKAIELDPHEYLPYFNRAWLKMQMSQSREDPLMYEALADLTKAIEINPTNGKSYLHRGMCKFRSLGWNVACNDFIKAIELGEELPDFIKSQLDDVGCN